MKIVSNVFPMRFGVQFRRPIRAQIRLSQSRAKKVLDKINYPYCLWLTASGAQQAEGPPVAARPQHLQRVAPHQKKSRKTLLFACLVYTDRSVKRAHKMGHMIIERLEKWHVVRARSLCL